jgi:phosphoglucosamine mutase
MLTALQIAGLCARAEAPLSTLLHGFERFPQLIENVRVASKPDFATLPTVAAARREVDEILGDSGRLVLRYSGTEPLARIMIEGPERATIEALAHRLADAIRTAIG